MKTEETRRIGILFQSQSLLSTIMLLLCITVISVLLVVQINREIKEQCFMVLTDSTQEACVRVENHFSSDLNSLRLLSRVIAQEDDLTSVAVNNILVTYNFSSITSNIAIITPENTIIQIRGGNIENNTIIDYDKEVAHGEHITGLQSSVTLSDQKIMRCFIPIKQYKTIVGMLFAEMNPSAIAQAWAPEIYDNAASFCVVDRTTGDLVINGWDDSIHNLSDIGSEALTDDILSRNSGFLQMQNTNGDDDIFISYMPMAMENWTILVTVPESIVFASAKAMRRSLQLFLIFVAVSVGLYLILMIYAARKSISETEKKANIDVLTGLQNRNRYEAFCKNTADKAKSLACIYIDANGLHEINNTRGHLAGDQMLRFIADTLKVAFGEDTVYRIGGDEFVVFQKHKSEEALRADLQNVHTEIERNDYHISSGICVHSSDLTVDEMIKTAEKRMYEAKRRYYEGIGKEVRNHLNES